MVICAPLTLNVFCIKHLIKGLLRSRSILNIKRCTNEKVSGGGVVAASQILATVKAFFKNTPLERVWNNHSFN